MAAIRVTIDANIFVSSLDKPDPEYAAANELLDAIMDKQIDMRSPWILPIEVVCSCSRKSIKYADRWSATFTKFNNTLYSVNYDLAEQAKKIGNVYRLKGMDAIYAAVSLTTDSILVTNDNDMLKKLSPKVQSEIKIFSLSDFKL
jgi:predicted nucleic acid-binding protein